jgi:tetratricopeptide (TPR) repeat protein
MSLDPNNKIVQLCAQGMSAEALGHSDEARALFQQAWDIASNDAEAFTAAHYLARVQSDPGEILRWNEKALWRALATDDDSVKSYYPSLHLNVGKAQEVLGNTAQAAAHYQLAAESSEFLPLGAYGDMIRSGIQAGLKRMGTDIDLPSGLQDLVAAWCERAELRPLAFILPVYISYLGTACDRQKLSSALSYVSAMRCLPAAEQTALEALVLELTGTAHQTQ